MPLLELPVPDRQQTTRKVEVGRLRFLIASTRGFCHGVERALRIADETLALFSDRRIFLTSEILHNPGLNQSLRSRGVRFLSEEPAAWNILSREDIVLLPAFGIAPRVRERLERTGVLLVDTTCGSVVYVWKSVDRFVEDGLTVVYHGRAGHEECLATLGRLEMPERTHPWVLVSTAADVDALIARLEGASDDADFLNHFEDRASPGFRPSEDLRRLGFANQTTMLARESLSIAQRIGEVQARRFPDRPRSESFRLQDTTCSATDERQEGLLHLLEEPLDIVLVVGGFNSSNTAHLAELAASQGVAAWHVEGADDVLSCRALRHRDTATGRLVVTRDWLPEGRVRVGISSGASTPDSSVAAVIERVAELAEP